MTFNVNEDKKVSVEKDETGPTPGCQPAFAMRMSIGPSIAWAYLVKADWRERREVRSAVNMWVVDWEFCAAIRCLVSSSCGRRRPRMAMLEALARAKERAIARPMPLPAPVMIMFLSRVERVGSVGSRAG